MKLSERIIKRLPVYFRILLRLRDGGRDVVSSHELGEILGINPNQIRKDLSYFGDFGTPGVGYRIDSLLTNLEDILGLESVTPVVLVGVGTLGQAFCRYNREDREYGIRISAVFDSDPEKIGTRVAGIRVRDAGELERGVRETGARLAILTVPAPAAQEVAERLVASGVRGVLNFAPSILRVPESVHVRNMDISIELQVLNFLVQQEGAVF